MLRTLALLCAMAALTVLPADAQIARRVALIVANADYAGYRPLPNTVVDAGLVADALRRAGFQSVEVRSNLKLGDLMRELGAFQGRAHGADVALVYFAGHGIEVGGKNWLIPTDAALENDAQLSFQAIEATRLIEAAAGARARMIVLDACRDNPFAARMRRIGTYGVTREAAAGLRQMDVQGARGTLLMYSAASGEVANDGVPGQGSPFARAFSTFLPTRDLELRLIAGKISDAVFAETAHAQLPFTSASLSGDPIYLVGGDMTVASNAELVAFNAAVEMGTPVGLDAFLAAYPDGQLSGQARRIREVLVNSAGAGGSFVSAGDGTRAPIVTPVLVELARTAARFSANGGHAIVLLKNPAGSTDSALPFRTRLVCDAILRTFTGRGASVADVQVGLRRSATGRIEAVRPIYWFVMPSASADQSCASRLSRYDYARAATVLNKYAITGSGPFLAVVSADEAASAVLNFADLPPDEFDPLIQNFAAGYASNNSLFASTGAAARRSSFAALFGPALRNALASSIIVSGASAGDPQK